MLLRDLVLDADGHAAPRLNDVELSEELALAYHALLLNQVVRMLCAGVIPGDLSEYNILVGADGPVIIDLPQAIDAAGNSNAAETFERDVGNLRSNFSAFAPTLGNTEHGKEMLLIGFGVKVPLLPLHLWLPSLAMGAPAGRSPYCSSGSNSAPVG